MTVRPAKTQISPGILPVWSESSLYTQWVAKDPSFLHADSESWADAQADLSLRWAHMPFFWFCHEADQMISMDHKIAALLRQLEEERYEDKTPSNVSVWGTFKGLPNGKT